MHCISTWYYHDGNEMRNPTDNQNVTRNGGLTFAAEKLHAEQNEILSQQQQQQQQRQRQPKGNIIL